LHRAGARLPSFAELADPSKMPQSRVAALRSVDPDRPDPANLFRVHWYNDRCRSGFAAIPPHFVLPPELTGLRSPILVALGSFFPMIAAHKLLAAYGCLIPHLVTGRFDPVRQKAVWPSTGNYCRGGIAISRVLGCRGIAVLPAGMSEERFEWLRAWVARPEDIIRTPGSESNVKEIYDRCAELARNPDNLVLNQFAEFGNYVAHYTCTGPALVRIFEAFEAQHSGSSRLAVFVAASGSAGTLAAGDYLKEKFGARIVAVEASECPTLLRNGFGEHNIQGIGDKHVPYIHNVMNTDLVVGVSDRSVAALDLLFNHKTGLAYLSERRRIGLEAIEGLKYLGLSSIANIVAAIKTAKRLELGDEDVLITVATDSAALYGSERRKFLAAAYPGEFDGVNAGEIFGQHLLGAADNDVLELTHDERSRIFNLGYFTWVEQQGVPLAEFERRRNQSFWRELHKAAAIWDDLIAEFNARAGFGEDC
jgi:cysteine synthase